MQSDLAGGTSSTIVQVPVWRTDDLEKWLLENPGGEFQLKTIAENAGIEVASFDTPLAVPSSLESGLYHPKEAYFSTDNIQQGLDFFRDNGFLLIPDAVSESALAAAEKAIAEDNAKDNGSPDVINAINGKIWDVVNLLVKDPVRPIKAQIAVNSKNHDSKVAEQLAVQKELFFPHDMHIDGLPNATTDDILNFTVLIGVPLDPFTEQFCGNFGVAPSSHLRIQDAVRCEGLEPLRTQQWLQPLKRISGASTHPFLPLRVKPGQAYIAHYQCVHFVMPNIHGSDPRRVMYYRIWNRRGDGFYMQPDLSCMSNVFQEFPGITGVPLPHPALEGKAPAPLQPQEIFQKYSGFMPDGGDICVGQMTVDDAKAVCQQMAGCKGFTFQGQEDGGKYLMCFKSTFQVWASPPDQEWTSYKYEAPFVKHDGFLENGSDLLVTTTTVQEAIVMALRLPGCKGFTFQGADGDGKFTIHFKSSWSLATHPDMVWTSYQYIGPPIVDPPPEIAFSVGSGS